MEVSCEVNRVSYDLLGLPFIQSTVVGINSLLNLIKLRSENLDQLLHALAATLLDVFTVLRPVTDVPF